MNKSCRKVNLAKYFSQGQRYLSSILVPMLRDRDMQVLPFRRKPPRTRPSTCLKLILVLCFTLLVIGFCSVGLKNVCHIVCGVSMHSTRRASLLSRHQQFPTNRRPSINLSLPISRWLNLFEVLKHHPIFIPFPITAFRAAFSLARLHWRFAHLRSVILPCAYSRSFLRS